MVVYHPHVHLLVTLGGVDAEGRWMMPRNADYLAPAKALAQVFRGTMTDALRTQRLLHHVSRGVWHKEWVADAQHAGDGERVLDYLGRYMFRVALSGSQIKAVSEDGVTFAYRDRKSAAVRTMTLPPLVFLARFLQHVLPRGFCQGARLRAAGADKPRQARERDRPVRRGCVIAIVRIDACAGTLSRVAGTAATPLPGLSRRHDAQDQGAAAAKRAAVSATLNPLRTRVLPRNALALCEVSPERSETVRDPHQGSIATTFGTSPTITPASRAAKTPLQARPGRSTALH
jgi:hypothetical protein